MPVFISTGIENCSGFAGACSAASDAAFSAALPKRRGTGLGNVTDVGSGFGTASGFAANLCMGLVRAL